MRNPAQAAEYDQLLADIAAGARLHYDEPGDDPDLALLQGDHLYARGLARLAELGDLPAIEELAHAISSVAEARARGDRDRAAAAWEAGAAAVLAGADGDAAASRN